ncbi:MAG: hypothetical protein Fur0037_08960 [Planctomycetota bacterium]
MKTLLPTALISILVPLAAPPAEAQQPDETGNAEIRQKVESLRRCVVEGRQIRSHVRVFVRLKNGNRMKGIVKDGRLVERVEGLRFTQAEANEKGAGIRVWYFDNSKNYVFLPFEDIAEYRVQATLTSEQLLAIEKKLAADEQKRKELAELERRKDAEPGPSGEQKAGEDPARGEGAKPAPPAPQSETRGLTEEQAKLFQLVQDYPPKDGWSAAKRDEIRRRLAVVGARPSEEELRFVEVFADWEKAVALFGLKVEEPAPKPQESGRRGKR